MGGRVGREQGGVAAGPFGEVFGKVVCYDLLLAPWREGVVVVVVDVVLAGGARERTPLVV